MDINTINFPLRAKDSEDFYCIRVQKKYVDMIEQTIICFLSNDKNEIKQIFRKEKYLSVFPLLSVNVTTLNFQIIIICITI